MFHKVLFCEARFLIEARVARTAGGRRGQTEGREACPYVTVFCRFRRVVHRSSTNIVGPVFSQKKKTRDCYLHVLKTERDTRRESRQGHNGCEGDEGERTRVCLSENCARSPFSARASSLAARACFRVLCALERAKNANTLNVITFIKLHCALSPSRRALAVRLRARGIFRRALRPKWRRGWTRSSGPRIHPQMWCRRHRVNSTLPSLLLRSLGCSCAIFRMFREFDCTERSI